MLIIVTLLISFIFISQWINSITSKCLIKNSSYPVFSKPIIELIPTNLGTDRWINCCINGVSKIVWSGRTSATFDQWSIISAKKGIYDLSPDNRTLTIINPTRFNHAGKYICEGTNDMGASINGSTEVIVAGIPKNMSFNIVEWSPKEPLTISPQSSFTLLCVVTVDKSSILRFSWNKLKNKKYISIMKGGYVFYDRSIYPLIDNYEGSSQMTRKPYNKFYWTYNLTLSMSSLGKVDEGTYICKFGVGSNNIFQEFVVLMRKSDELPILVLISIIVCFILLTLVTFIFRYNIQIITKDVLRILIFQKYHSKKYNFFFVYNFDDRDEFKVIKDVVHTLEAKGFSCHYFHRDQTYGYNTLQDLSDNIANSHIAVIWTSESFLDNSKNNFCINTLINNFGNVTRIYVLTSSKKRILLHCKSDTISADIVTWPSSNFYELVRLTTTYKVTTRIWLYWRSHMFISWLISSLPLQL